MSDADLETVVEILKDFRDSIQMLKDNHAKIRDWLMELDSRLETVETKLYDYEIGRG